LVAQEDDMIEDALIETLRPLVRALVQEEVERAKLQWRWWPVERVAELLGITPKAVRHRVLRGQMPGKNVNGRVFVDMLEYDRQISRVR
jgi:hypothetical protein